ncbi:M12 family metallopeptidase [Hyalangium rubrum]|uniref:M12 family metallopeptidase n=1 Tax=Hyalangium rubrum TaxID=3103134 RepID=A0ABU5GXA1_9BACT|nr:M12 family metallopeptidase [Hyalangium sp. s54d21]MDY7225329.1 M12 family metallopeptidase [Hyalangium sp. s54d21]
MTRVRLFHPLALALLLAAPAMVVHAKESMGKGMPPPPEFLPESKPLAPWQSLMGDEKPTTLMAIRAGASKPSPMVVVKRGDLAITEGDIVVGWYSQLMSDFSQENAIRNPNQKWPKINGKVVVPYQVHSSLPSAQRAALNAAIAEYNAKTCVRFVPKTTEANFVTVILGNGCYSYIGSIQQGAQELSLGQGCEFKGTAVHELMHALGFDHEQSRPDRDQYLTVNYQNVVRGMESQFDVCQDCTTQNIPYEYSSIMHYGAQAFTNNGRDTMVPKQRGAQLAEPYDKPGLTTLDVKKIHKLYGC